MNTATLKKLAYLTAEQPAVPDAVIRFYERRLTRAHRKKFLFYLRQAWGRRQVYVRTAGTPDASVTGAIARRYPGSILHVASAPALGGGLQIEHDDTIIDISFRRMVETAFRRIRDSR